jgi:HlyD family secretion protein
MIDTKKWFSDKKKLFFGVLGLIIIAILALIGWQKYRQTHQSNIFSGNGRIEATEINIAPRIPGQVKELYVKEGDYVKSGQVLVQMDTDSLEAQLKEAQGKLLEAQNAVVVNQSKLAQKRSEKASSVAVLRQRDAELVVAEKRMKRSSTLIKEGATSQQTADDDFAGYKSSQAAVDAATAQVEAAEAALITAEKEIVRSESAVDAAKGTVERIQADINDSALKSPRDGRVQFRVAQVGEVIAAGNPVVSLVDLSDVYMTFFLPTIYAGQISIGEEARIILDAAPQFIIPAYISFISDVAQFTPKTVETATEREKLTFRIKAQIPEKLLKEHMTMVKTGLPGMAYIRLDPEQSWPESLKANL